MSFRMFAPFALLLAVAPLSAMTGTPSHGTSPMVAKTPLIGQKDPVSVLTYNIKGLPWPLASDREAAFVAIEGRLRGLRAVGKQPHVMVLQEAFTERAKQIGANSGYVYHADGPARDDGSVTARTTGAAGFESARSALKGETEGKWTDSGLQIFSDYPIVEVKRAAFGADRCAGFDCLANKGALLVELRVPGREVPVTVVATHLNSRHASGVADGRSLEAYRRQLGALADFLASNRDPRSPLILAGDFNASSAARRALLVTAKLVPASTTRPSMVQSALEAVVSASVLPRQIASEAAYITGRGRDWQFFGDGSQWSLKPAGMSIPFGREKNGSSLSDHFGFVIDYK